jgi:SAM-dependent methyltransferase
MRYAEEDLLRSGKLQVLDIGCGAGRNAVPLAGLGCAVLGTDLSLPMIEAALERSRQTKLAGRLQVVIAPMDRLPVRDRSVDFVVAHGIWNLARSAAEFRDAVREAGRVARPGAALFVFTFSRNTLAPDAPPVPEEPFVFTQFSGRPQCFLTDAQLVEELARGGFTPDAAVPLQEHNRPHARALRTSTVPVIYEGGFRFEG